MKQWSILSNKATYVIYKINPVGFYRLDIRTIQPKYHNKMYDKLQEDDRKNIYLDLGITLRKLKGQYMDVCENIESVYII